MDGLPPWALALCGLILGSAAGFAVRRGRLCTFGAVEDALIGRDTRRLKVFGLALAVALAGTQVLAATGLFDPGRTIYLNSSIPWLSIATGSLLFGLGMALVGTCSFGSLVRLGGGDLRSLIVLLVLAAVAFASLRGILAEFRVAILERVFVHIDGLEQADLPSALVIFLGYDLRAIFATAIALALGALALSEQKLRRSPRLLLAGVTLGLCVVFGWLATALLADDFASANRPQSLTFVAPVARLLYGLLLNDARLLDFGSATVVGVVVGAWIAARAADDFRWEAFDDDHEMRRHLAGAALMGLGGILAGGCSIGQGLSAGSLMALSWPIAMAGGLTGARLGIFLLMGGNIRELVQLIFNRKNQ